MIKICQILIVEDDLTLGTLLKDYLELHHYKITHCVDGMQGKQLAVSQHFDLCILDVMIPKMNGWQLAGEIRARKPKLPFIFLTAVSLKEDIIKGLKIGAEDYITKPFDSEILLLKIEAILKRNQDQNEVSEFVLGSYCFRADTRVLKHRSGTSQRLSPTETKLFLLLHQNINRVLSREEALRKIWGDDSYFTARSMDVYMTKLRKYLDQDDSIRITTVPNSGFMLENDN